VNPTFVDVTPLAIALREFSSRRDWNQFHTAKNLAMALSVEAAELLEPFQWLTPEQSMEITADPGRSARIAEELADVLIYLVRLADILNVDLNHAVATKLALNAEKYPVDRAKGSAAKYTEHDS
jgi:NTP pyrophosphatase (non-canonical NTP hydrolase)